MTLLYMKTLIWKLLFNDINGSEPGQFCPSSGHSAMSGDIFTCLNLRWGRCCCRFSRLRPGTYLNILQCREQHHATKNYPIQKDRKAKVEKLG